MAAAPLLLANESLRTVAGLLWTLLSALRCGGRLCWAAGGLVRRGHVKQSLRSLPASGQAGWCFTRRACLDGGSRGVCMTVVPRGWPRGLWGVVPWCSSRVWRCSNYLRTLSNWSVTASAPAPLHCGMTQCGLGTQRNIHPSFPNTFAPPGSHPTLQRPPGTAEIYPNGPPIQAVVPAVAHVLHSSRMRRMQVTLLT